MPEAKISKRRAINVALLPAPHTSEPAVVHTEGGECDKPIAPPREGKGNRGVAGSPRRNGQFGGPELANANHRQGYLVISQWGDTTIVLGHKSQSAVV